MSKPYAPYGMERDICSNSPRQKSWDTKPPLPSLTMLKIPFVREKYPRHFPTLITGGGGGGERYAIQLKCPNYFCPVLKVHNQILGNFYFKK